MMVNRIMEAPMADSAKSGKADMHAKISQLKQALSRQ
jgi:hypothetical protein